MIETLSIPISAYTPTLQTNQPRLNACLFKSFFLFLLTRHGFSPNKSDPIIWWVPSKQMNNILHLRVAKHPWVQIQKSIYTCQLVIYWFQDNKKKWPFKSIYTCYSNIGSFPHFNPVMMIYSNCHKQTYLFLSLINYRQNNIHLIIMLIISLLYFHTL